MDDRLKKDIGRRDVRSSPVDTLRQSAEDRFQSSRERRRAFREFEQAVLPPVPQIPGFHTCWLSTTNQYDPIHRRERIGYVRVKPEEVPGFDSMTVKSGEFSGSVSCNEMVLFKIAEEDYQDMMEYYHHERPIEESDRLSRSYETLAQQFEAAHKSGGKLTVEGDGMASGDPRVPTPIFEG